MGGRSRRRLPHSPHHGYTSHAASSKQVGFSQVAGLWIILAACVGASLLLVALHLWRHRWRAHLGRSAWVRRHLPRALWHSSSASPEALIEKAGSKLVHLTEPVGSEAFATAAPAAPSSKWAAGERGWSEGGGSSKGMDPDGSGGGGGVQQQLAALAAAVAELAAEQRRLAALLER